MKEYKEHFELRSLQLLVLGALPLIYVRYQSTSLANKFSRAKASVNIALMAPGP